VRRRAWCVVCAVTVDGRTETWATDKPEVCPRCGWAPQLVKFHILDDWWTVG
jgi:hypothetical protein